MIPTTERDDLEQALAAMFARRAQDIAPIPAAIDSAPAKWTKAEPAGRPVHRLTPGHRTRALAVAAAVAAVLIAVVGTIVGIQARTSSAPPAGSVAPTPPPRSLTGTPSPTPTRACTVGIPASWTAALARHRVHFDQTSNEPIGGLPDGSVLFWQYADAGNGSNSLAHSELALFDRAGRGQTLWSEDGSPNYPLTDRAGAGNADWIVFGMTRVQNSNMMHAVEVWDRNTGSLRVLRTLSNAEESAQQNHVISVPPVVIGDTVYWVEQTYDQPQTQRLVSANLSGPTKLTSQPLTGIVATRLLVVGNRLAFANNDLNGRSTLRGGDTIVGSAGLTVPNAVSARTTGTTEISSDGSYLHWVSADGSRSVAWQWTAGQSDAGSASLPFGQVFSDLTVPLIGIDPAGAAEQPTALYDQRSNAIIRIGRSGYPAISSGGTVVFVNRIGSTIKSAPTVSLVPLSELPAPHC